jgi:hypothetical protein
VQRAPGFPCSLYPGGMFVQTSGTSRRENADVYLESVVIARSDLSTVAQRAKAEATEAIHSLALPRGNGLLRGACHRAALCADPLARNDGRRIFPAPFMRKAVWVGRPVSHGIRSAQLTLFWRCGYGPFPFKKGGYGSTVLATNRQWFWPKMRFQRVWQC